MPHDDYTNMDDGFTVFHARTPEEIARRPEILVNFTAEGRGSSVTVDGVFLPKVYNIEVRANVHTPLLVVVDMYEIDGSVRVVNRIDHRDYMQRANVFVRHHPSGREQKVAGVRAVVRDLDVDRVPQVRLTLIGNVRIIHHAIDLPTKPEPEPTRRRILFP